MNLKTITKDEITTNTNQWLVGMASKYVILADFNDIAEARTLQATLAAYDSRICIYSIDEWNRLS